MDATIPWIEDPDGPSDLIGVALKLGIPLDADWAMIASREPVRLNEPTTLLAAKGPRTDQLLPFEDRARRGWDGYHLNVVGCFVPPSPAQPPWPRWKIEGVDGPMELQIWRFRAFLPAPKAFAEVNWSPSAGGVSKMIQIAEGWESLPPSDQDKAVLGAAGGMRAIEGILKPGPTAMTDEEAFEEAIRLGLEWLAHTPGAEPSDFTREQYRQKRCVGREGIKAWMREKHIKIKVIQRELERRISRP